MTATGLAVGIATQTTVYGEDTDYWIVPEGGGDTSALVATDGPQFGDVHETTATMESIDGVRYATPVLSAVRFTEGPSDNANVLFVGIIPRDGMGAVSGVSPSALTVDDAPGTPTREWRGEAVLSDSAASQLGVAANGDTMVRTDGEAFSVVSIESGTAATDLPIAVVHLSDLQRITGAEEFDSADQFLVSTSRPGVQGALESIHPQASVDTRADLTTRQVIETDTALAMAVGAFGVTFVVGALFMLMTAGLNVTADAATIGTLSAIGISKRSQATLAGTQTILTAICGGILGAGLGLGALVVINEVVTRTVLSVPVVSVHPAFALYGIGAALVIGLVSVPYVRYLLRQIGAEEVLH